MVLPQNATFQPCPYPFPLARSLSQMTAPFNLTLILFPSRSFPLTIPRSLLQMTAPPNLTLMLIPYPFPLAPHPDDSLV